jgi:hypothetical protein
VGKKLLFSFIPLVTFVTFVTPAFAASLKIVESPKEVEVEASSSAKVEFSIRNKDTPYFLIAALCKETCSRIFGGTFVEDDWVFYKDEGFNFYPIVTDENGYWSGSIGFIANKDSKGYKGPGEYFLRVGRYTVSGKTLSWCEKEDRVPITIADDSWGAEDIVADDITHIRDLPLGTKVQTQGLVTVGQGTLEGDVFYIEDDFSGIKVDLPKDFQSGVKLGDKVKLGCTIEESRGEKYIKFDDNSVVTILETNLACRNPSRIGTGERLDNWEGRFVEVEAEVVETSGDTFYLDDGSGWIKVYIKESTGIDKPPMRRGDLVRVKGIISQWGQHKDGSDNYRLMPRYAEDLVVFPVGKSDSEEDDDIGEVLGAISELPETGGGVGILLLTSFCIGGVHNYFACVWRRRNFNAKSFTKF